MDKGEWLRGMGEGNGFRPVSCKGCPDCGAAPPQSGVCPWPLWNKSNKWKFPFVPYSCILDRFWTPYGAFLKELTDLRLDC